MVDYRTEFSGVRPHNLVTGENFDVVRREVSALLHNRILVGHSVHRDLYVLSLKHPKQYVRSLLYIPSHIWWFNYVFFCSLIRDTSQYPPLTKMALLEGGNPPSLRLLAQRVLNKTIQKGEHCSVEDSMTAMELYKCFENQWERDIRKGN